MRAIIADNNWIYFENITPVEEDAIWHSFSVSKPNVYLSENQRGDWDGVFRKYNRAKKRMARPLLSMLRGVCEKRNLPLVVVDNRDQWEYPVLSPEEVNADFLPNITLGEDQVAAIRKGITTECMIFDIPTGGGKTEILCGLCKAIECPTLIIADQTVVIDQIKSRLELRDVGGEIGMFYAGKRPNGEMVIVGSIQSLSTPTKVPEEPMRTAKDTDATYRRKLKNWESRLVGFKTRKKNAKVLQEYARKAEMVIVDECDKCSSKLYKNMFRFLYSGRRRYGFSGTPLDESKPVEGMDMQEMLGSIGFSVDREYLQDAKRIIEFEYYMLAFGLQGSRSDASTYDIAYSEWITQNPNFHGLVAQLCQKSKRCESDGVLILVDREELGHNLETAVASTGLRCAFIFGKTPKRRRTEILRAFERRELDVLIGGKIINRGLDLSGGCETLIIATGGKLRSDFIQKIGRAVRHNKRGKSRVYDFFFMCNKYLYQHSRARLDVVLTTKCKSLVVFPGGKIDGAQLKHSRYRISAKYLTGTR